MSLLLRTISITTLAASLCSCAVGVSPIGKASLVYSCLDGDGSDAGRAVFEDEGGAKMVLSIGIVLDGRTVSAGPLMVGEVFWGRRKIVFKIPHSGGPSEVSMYPPSSGQQPSIRSHGSLDGEDQQDGEDDDSTDVEAQVRSKSGVCVLMPHSQ